MAIIEHPYVPHPFQKELHDLLAKHRFGVIVAHRRFGKTVFAVNTLVQAALFEGKYEGRYAYLAPYYGQAKDVAWNYIKQYCGCVPNVKFNESETSATLPNGARIRIYGADNPDALRGIYLDGVVLDEIADMKENMFSEVIRPMLSDRNGWAVFIGTPKGVNLLFDMYQRAGTPEYKDWFRACYRADQTNIIAPSELAAARRDMTDAKFAQEYLCDFTISDDSAIIPLSLAIDASGRTLSDAEVKGGVRVLGVDVAGSTTGRDETVIFPVCGLKAYEPIILEGADTLAIVNRIIDTIKWFEPDYTRIDLGYGHGVFDMLRSYGYRAMGVHFGGTPRNPGYYANVRAEIWDGTRKWLEAGGCIPKDEKLIRQLSMVCRRPDTSNHKLMLESKKDLPDSPDRADALCLAVGVPLLKPNEDGGGIRTMKNKASGLRSLRISGKNTTAA